MSLLDESGILGIATRLQRLSNTLRSDGFRIYQEYGIDFEPKWFSIMFALHSRPGLSVVELAAEIGFSHPSTITLLKELEKAELVTSKKHPTDERKRLLQLSKKGNELIEQMKPVWNLISKTLTELTSTQNNLMEAILETEAQLKDKSFFDRAKNLSGH